MYKFSFSKTRMQVSALCVAGAIGFVSTAVVAQTSGEMYMTRYGGTPNIGKLDFSYDGTAFTVSNINWFADTPGADGIIGNPQAPGELLIGAQSYNAINRLNPLTGELTVYASPGDAYRLVATDSKTVFASGWIAQ